MKNKIISILVIVCMLFVLPLTGYALSGKGTEANPFRITNEDELLLLADFPECYFELENDIELTKTWEPVADFSGSFDGKGHTITVSDFVVKTNTGFFGTLSGTVKNLTIHADDVSESNSSSADVGLFAGECSGIIENCKATGSFGYTGTYNGNSAKHYVGGFCGNLSGSIKNSIAQFELLYFSESSYSYVYAGGICGDLTGTIECCVNNSNIKRLYSSYGGLAHAVQKDASIINSMNLEKSISSCSYYAGVTYTNYGTITNCYSVGGKGTTGNKYGIASNNTGGTMTNCYYDKVVLGNTSTSYGNPKSTIAMKMEATYNDWDFENIWGLDESEENPINDGYPYLRYFYADHKNPATDSAIKVVDGKLVVDTKIAEANEDYIVHIALYGEENRLCGYIIVPNERELKDVFVVYPDDGKAQFAKVFTWYSTDTMVPVSDCETITIER